MNMGCFPSHEVTTTTFDDNQNHDDGTTNDVNNNNNNNNNNNSNTTTATIAPATTNAAATTTATGTSLEVVLSSSSDPHVTSHKNTSVASPDHTIPLPVTIQATNTTSTSAAAATAVSSITVATTTSTTTEPIHIKPDLLSSQQPPPPHTSAATNTNATNNYHNTTTNTNKKSKSDGDLLEATVSTTDGNAQHRPASAPATTTKPTLHFVNKLSPSVAHSSLAPQRAGDDHHHHPTNTAGNHDGTTAAATAHTLPDNISHQSDHTDATGDTNTTNRLFQKMTEGGEEAIHHLRNIFATPISFAVHAMSRGLPQLHNAYHPNNYTMPNYPKTDYERNFLQKVLQKHYLFDSQSVSSLQKLINAFEICTIDVQDPKAIPVHDDMTNTTQYHVNIIQQGEEVMTHPNNNAISNAYFYVVYYGKCQFCVDDTVVGYANPGDAFGELALLYNGPRAATVTAILQEQVDMDDTNSMAVVDDHNEVDADHDADDKEEEDHENDTTAMRGGKRPTSHVVSSTVSDIASISGMELGSNPKTNVVDDNMDDVVTVTAPLPPPPPPFPDYTVVLFRVHQRSFRIILQQDDQDTNDVTMNLLNNIEFLQNVPLSVKENLARVMVPFPFNKGDHILQKGIMDCPWYVIERGTVLASNLEHGYQDFCFHEGQCFGERAIMADAPAIGDVYAETAGVGFTVDHDTFKTLIGNVLGSNTNIISRQQDVAKLKGIGILSSATQTDHRVLNYLSKQITDQTFPVGAIICRVGEPLIHPPSLYLVRNGKVRLDYVDQEPIYIVMDAYFGEDQLQSDMAGKDRKGTYISEMAGKDRKGTYISPYTATVVEECTCGTLKLRDCRNVIDTRRMGEEDNILEFDSLSLNREIDKGIKMKDLSVHRMIGAGTFGQVFLVSRSTADGPERVYALKVQSKYELCQSGQAKGVVREKNLMTLFHHPFVARLLAAFQDEKCVYMVMNLLQGGELYSIMHTKTSNVLPEKSAKFYIACVAEALFYLHCSHSLVFRDLKPENVMIDDQGYAILIDFGFCKKISGKTYTTCGTPLYLAPEVILNRGHSWSVDYWSLGIMIYEMLVGHTPFYEHGMNKAELFQNIIRGKVYPPTDVSPEVLSLLSGLLRRDPAKRLGSLIGNENDIIDHPWFREIDRDRLFLKELDAPFLPKIKDPFDSSNFSSWKHVDDKRFVRYPALSPDDEVIFKDF